jgi:hypothetical protein
LTNFGFEQPRPNVATDVRVLLRAWLGPIDDEPAQRFVKAQQFLSASLLLRHEFLVPAPEGSQLIHYRCVVRPAPGYLVLHLSHERFGNPIRQVGPASLKINRAQRIPIEAIRCGTVGQRHSQRTRLESMNLSIIHMNAVCICSNEVGSGFQSIHAPGGELTFL